VSDKPILWHIPISHFSEKARWALAYKGIEHERRAPLAGAHMAVAMWLTRGRSHTFPVLRIAGRTLGDSTAIIAALEELHPEPPLYPGEPADRERALELEEFFDERVGPAVRLGGWHHMRNDEEGLDALVERELPPAIREAPLARRGARAYVRAYTAARYRVSNPEAEAEARASVRAGLDRLEHELGSGDYLVGDAFSVADLTAASLLYPIARPPEGPRLPEPSPSFGEFLAEVAERPGIEWVREMFRRHRKRG